MSAKSVAVAVLLLIATYVPAFTAISLLVTLNPSFASAVKLNPWMPAAIVVGVTLCIAILLIAIVGKGRSALYGFKLPQGSVLKALATGFLVGTLLYCVAMFGSVELTWMGQPSLIIVILLFWIGAPIQEEIIFRGLFQGYLATRIKRSIAVWRWKLTIPALIGAIVFSLVHFALLSVEASLGGVFLIVVGAFILGIIAGQFRAETGSLVGPIIIHALFNVTGTVFELLALAL